MIKHLIHDNICKILQDLNLSQQREFTVEIPNLADHGDYSSNVAMILAKENKTSPKVLAEKLIKELKKNKYYKKVELAGPGFLNFHLSKVLYHNMLWEIHKAGSSFGDSDFGKEEKVLLEFVSANPTGL